MIRDRTEEYYRVKEEVKEWKKQIDKRDFLAYIHDRASNSPSSSFPTINFIKRGNDSVPAINNNFNSNNNIGTIKPLNIPPPIHKPQEKLTDKPNCLNCGKAFGLFTSKYQCSLCNINFCNGCLKILSSKDITGVLKDGQVRSYCPRCHLIVTKEEIKRRFHFGCEKSVNEPILQLYNEITLVKRSILGSLPSFEYLASSVTDFKLASKNNRDTFSQVYNEVIILQNDLAVLFKDFDKHLKAVMLLPTTSHYQDTIKKNMKSLYYTFLQQNLPKFKNIQTDLLHIELNTIRNTYIYLARSGLDNRMQPEFWYKYGKAYQDTMALVRKDLQISCTKCKEDYDKVKNLIDEMIVNEEKSNLNIRGNPKHEEEGTLIRKNKEFLKNIYDQVNIRVKPEELENSKRAILTLFKILDEDYNNGLK
ncbi:hypothetical protein DICPUDRAFT_77225 [Dictyostelium purpureum]|uniref:FYVE-type domain-containing protein n=1 Tax=Dictyostelium purpureum TaxID=5786 RepID=F0ZFZ4_DICPU|nr:uncharacterized protein DICPUDRAFT_77225 [Dictyostelium purpureum]EGC37126.1 hypothetical protein DICPUDRAFT_77225 [Dictyostelium purpureum]|eukprot:XP_003286329.1 hypothetical protein DICPUDRAFT_77225 [Dictyostelium purpureum]